MAMPWTKAKRLAQEYRTGIRDVKQLTALFDACFRIQREAIEAAGHFIPLVVENVRGAQPWVGRSRWNFGSFHLWGDVPALMPMAKGVLKAGVVHRSDGSTNFHQGKYGVKAPGMNWSDQEKRGQDFTRIAGKRADGIKNGGRLFPNEAADESIKLGGSWFHGYKHGQGPRNHGSKSKARKRASAMIAKIPLALSRHIAAAWHPQRVAA